MSSFEAFDLKLDTAITRVRPSPSSKFAVFIDLHKAVVRNLASGKSHDLCIGLFADVAWGKDDGSFVFFSANSRTLKLFKHDELLQTYRCEHTFDQSIYSFATFVDQNTILVQATSRESGGDKEFRIIDLASYKEKTYPLIVGMNNHAAYCDNWLAFWDQKKIQVWQLLRDASEYSPRLIQNRSFPRVISDVQISGTSVAVADSDGSLWIYDTQRNDWSNELATKNELKKWKAWFEGMGERRVRIFAISQQGGNYDITLTFYDSATLFVKVENGRVTSIKETNGRLVTCTPKWTVQQTKEHIHVGGFLEKDLKYSRNADCNDDILVTENGKYIFAWSPVDSRSFAAWRLTEHQTGADN